MGTTKMIAAVVSNRLQTRKIRRHSQARTVTGKSLVSTARFKRERVRLTLCKYSYANSVKPNWGLLLIIRAGPPLNKAPNPSSWSTMMRWVSGAIDGINLGPTYFYKSIRESFVVRLALSGFNLQSSLHDI